MLNHYKKKKPSCQAKEQKSTPMHRQHATLRVVESLARFIALLPRREFALSNQARINPPATVSPNYLLGEAHFVRKRLNKNLFKAFL